MEVLDFLESEIEKIRFTPEMEEIGRVVEIKDEVCKIEGLFGAQVGEVLMFEGKKDVFGLVLTLEEGEIGAILFGKTDEVKEGVVVKRTGKTLSFPVGESLIGRIIDPLGRPLDEKGDIEAFEFYPLERVGPSVVEREPVNFPLHTGIKVIDALIPLGRGQRELILGDRICDKTSLCLDIIINQKNEPKRPICVYVAIGQRARDLTFTVEFLRKRGALEYSVIVACVASDPVSLWYLAPYAGCAVGEYFMHNGKDALVIYDSLEKHAFAWRQISLILRKPPGREAYPGDIFYLHSRLLERAAKLNQKKGGGSLTAIPVFETVAGDITAYIPTNLISICDGQIILDTGLLLKGQKPEINIGLSVSRVGSAAQTKAMKKVSKMVKLEIAQFQELEKFLEFAEEVDPETRKKLERGKRLREVLKQESKNPLPFEKEVAIFFAVTRGFLDEIPVEKISDFEKEFYQFLDVQRPDILKKIRESKDLDLETEIELEKAIKEVLKNYVVEGS